MGGSRATKAERMEAHRIKMEMRDIKNHENHKQVAARSQYVWANISQHHDEYGETPEQQTKRMLEKSS